MARTADIRIGISGWRYKGWRGTFYPKSLPQRSELQYAATHFNTIELNGSFYSLQRPEYFQNWYDETPKGFVFAVKGTRYLTHMLRLTKIEAALANFLAQGILCLREKLGPILWQFPPQMRFNPERFEEFFSQLPRSQMEAAEFGRRHDHRLDGRDWLNVTEDRQVRHAVEIRHESFVCEEFVRLLRRYNVALVVADTVEWPLLMDVTADFVYCRLHGSEQLYASGYEADAIRVWGDRVLRWSAGLEVEDGRKACKQNARCRKSRDVYVYFDNDAKVRAPVDAMALCAYVDTHSICTQAA